MHHLCLSIQIRGPLDVEAMRRALQAVVTRNDVLRTVFRRRDGRLEQQVTSDVPQFAIHDLEATPAAEQRSRLAAIRTEQTRRGFDLASGPLTRFVLVIKDFDEYELIVVVHRIVADEASLELFLDELLAGYPAFAARRRPDAAVPPLRFADHAARLAAAAPAADLGFWREYLADLGDPLPLPFAQARGKGPVADAQVLPFALPEHLRQQLRELALAQDCTPYTAMVAALVVLLHRYTNRHDITLGTQTPGRDSPQAGQVIGPFGEQAVLRVQLPDDPTWRQVLDLTREAIHESQRHQPVSFAQVLGAVRPVRHPDLHPIFQVLVAPPLPAGGRRELGEVSFDVTCTDSGQARHDLEFRVDDGAGHLKPSGELFTPEQAQVILRHYTTVLERMINGPDQHLSGHSLLDDAQQQQILHGWNQTATDYPRDRTIVEIFGSWAQHAPDAPALRWEGFALTYRELDTGSSRLANHLRELGIGLETGVGLYFGYTADWVVAALATLKAGGYYVPLDPSYPQDRLVAMCQDAEVRVLLAHEGALPPLESTGITTLFLDTSAELLERQPATGPRVAVDPEHLAYVMFTSGSTGRAKGIGVTHRNVLRTVCNTSYVDLGTADRVAQASNISFDAATFEVWGALLNGSQLIGLRKEDVLDPDRLKAQLRASAITVFFQPAALMKQIVAEKPDTFGSLKYFFSGGEQADLNTIRRMLRHGAPENMINPYGPTETTVFAVVQRCNDLPDTETYVPIGVPIDNTTAYVLDGYLQPVPAGVVGELFIGGDGVARGYVGRPDLTAATFVADPFAGEPGARLYRTGDLARYRPDGTLDFLGRIDRQVKIRGFRVEPAEIETCLLDSAAVGEVSVQVGVDRSGDQVLIAYVTPARNGAGGGGGAGDGVVDGVVDGEALRAYARDRLPVYMVPHSVVTLAAFPLNANGKLDIRRLTASAPLDADRPAPEPDAAEALLLRIWRELLQHEELQAGDNVFSAGADSLLAARAVDLAGAQAGVELPYRLPFEQQSVAAMAAVLRELAPAVASAEPSPVSVGAGPQPRDTASALRDRAERLLAIWRDVLEAPALGPDDDFFANGGHSLKVVRVKSRVRSTFGLDVPVSLLFENRTVNAFAAAMAGIGAGDDQVAELLAPIRAVDGGENIDDLLREIEKLTGE